MQFTETNIAELFGHEAAEDEDIQRLKSYYLKGSIYDNIANELPIRILVGHKGIGKSALFRVAISEETQDKKLSILIKPNDISDLTFNNDNFLSLIRDWKSGIFDILSKKVIDNFGVQQTGWKSSLNNYGGKLIDFLQETLRADRYANLDPTKKFVLDSFLTSGNIYVYMDDLDRGWRGNEADVRNISALLNAVRDIASENRGVHFRISLRSDVYYLVRTSDESTDKIEGSVVWLSWQNHEILALLVKRVEQYFGVARNAEELFSLPPKKLAQPLDRIMAPTFNGRGHWSNIPTYRMLMSLVRKRPRDLVKLCTLAARDAQNTMNDKITSENFNNIFEEYSQGRLQDTINEYRSELPEIERLLLGMRPTTVEKRTKQGYYYNTANLLKKIRNVQQSGVFKFHNGKFPDERDLASFLYKINFITARKDAGEYIDRKYFEENRYLSSKFADFGYDWEVHPAYRWALQPGSLRDIFDNIKPSND